jgi:hypothetical protein
VPAIRTQVVFDATDPHALAAFWADALHYEHEDIDAFVGGLVDAGHVPHVGGRSPPCAIPTTPSTSAGSAWAAASSSRPCRSPRR